MVFLESHAFTAKVRAHLPDDQYRLLQATLIQSPALGDLISGSGGLRKIRWAGSGRGKRGGFRIIYFWHKQSNRILFLFGYLKNEASDLTPAQCAALRKVIEMEYV